MNRGGFAEWLIVTWGAVEGYMDVALIAEFGLLNFAPPPPSDDQHSVESQVRQVMKRARRKDEQIELPLDLPFNKKMEFLVKIGAIKKNERTVLRQFQKDRNRCFHGGIWGSKFINLSNDEKTLIMNHAEKALDISSDVMSRLLPSWRVACK